MVYKNIYNLSFIMKHTFIYRSFFVILFVMLSLSVIGQNPQINWTEVAPGVWKGVVGKPEGYDLLKASGSVPNKEALSKMVTVVFPISQNDISGIINDGKTFLRFPLEEEEQLYGFGLNFQTVHQRGRILQLHMDHYGGKDNGRTHAPVPFYVSSKGYGVFINSARYIDVYAGTGVRKDSKNPPQEKDRNTDKSWSSRPYSDAVEIVVPGAGTEVYVVSFGLKEFSTVWLAKDGMNLETGSSSENLPSSHNIITATVVMAFV